jgi:F-type H+-transporting ATPase subunit b
MKRVALLPVLALALLIPAAHAQGQGGEDRLELWKWANFALLAAGLGYLIAKSAPPLFAARSRKIREDMAEAERLREQAEARLNDVGRRLDNLESEMAALRAEAEMEARRESQRMRVETEAEMVRIRVHAEQEIAAAGKAARLELKRYSAQLAIRQAELMVRERLTPGAENELVRDFVRGLDRPAPPQTR